LCQKARGDIEIIAVLDGYWPTRIADDKRVHYIHFTKPRGMRPGLNAACAIATGDYVMKLDAHCMVSEGFDVVLAETCRENWVCVPRRKRLDGENWCVQEDGRVDINYLFIDLSNDGLNGKQWHQKNVNRSLDAIRIDDLIAAQGSFYFMRRAWWHEMELLDVEHYGTFRKDPQEVIFKTWTSGGRCVRVKDAWYAHLYKGRKYGRGYSNSRRDWDQGDEYVKQWWTDSAWGKQKIPLCDIIRERFADMPGWEDHEWTKGARKERPVRKLPRTYQVLKLPNGDYFTRPRPGREQSRFWNEGKWDTFVAPLLPGDPAEQTLIEMGTEVGLFLKMAKDHGYRNVIGIEKDKTPVAIAGQYRDTIGYDYRVMKRSLGNKFHEPGTFNIDELPCADVTLISNFHYHIDLNSWIKYVDRLRGKSVYVLLVSVAESHGHRWLPGATLDQVRTYFADWKEVATVENVRQEGDSDPRPLYSVLFKNPLLRRMPFSEMSHRGGEGDMGIRKLTEQVLTNEEIDLKQTAIYEDWRRREPKWSERTLLAWCASKLQVVKLVVSDDGIRDPVLMTGNKIADGHHRRVILQALGYNSVIVRLV
jgi:glycosyltransferase involved in cell wall biosynthesis